MTASTKAVPSDISNDTMVNNHDGDNNNNNKKEEVKMASLGQLFSFARTRKIRIWIALAFFFAIISGLSLPGT
jgi:hypothetical protein